MTSRKAGQQAKAEKTKEVKTSGVETKTTEVAKDTPAKKDAEEDTALGKAPETQEKSESNSLVISSGNISMSSVSSSASKEVDTSLVKVLVKYPANYEGSRQLVDGREYEMSRESADLFIAKGIATEIAKEA